jgi:hypothetical protein
MNCSRRPTASQTFPALILQIVLRRAALIIRNTGGIDLDPGIQDTCLTSQ